MFETTGRGARVRRIRRSVAPLRVRPFARLASTYTVNETGDSIAVVALAVLVYDATQSALATTALFVATKFLPAFTAPALTARLDQLDLRKVLPALYLAEAGVFALLAVLAESFSLPAVLGLGVVDGTIALTGRALSRSAAAVVLSEHGLLREGNGIINVGFAVASVGGAALGGFLVAQVGVSTALLFDAGSFLIAALLIAGARGLPRGEADPEPFWQRLRGGLGHAGRDARIRLLLGGQGIALICFTLVLPVEVVYAKETLGTGDAGYGILLAAWGAGIVVGSALYLTIARRSLVLALLGSTGAVGLAYVGMAAVDELWAACALSVLGGAGNGVQWVSVVTALQENTPADLQARVTGLLESLAAAAPGVGFVIGGALASIFSPPVTFAVAGAGVLALTAFGSLVVRRQRAASTPTVVR